MSALLSGSLGSFSLFLLQVFLVVANSREDDLELSVVYRWNQHHFVQHQTLQTHSAVDWEAFHIGEQHFLVVANHRRGERVVGVAEAAWLV